MRATSPSRRTISSKGLEAGKPALDEAAKTLLDGVLERRPLMMQARLRPKIERVIGLLLSEKKASEADAETVKEALRLVIPRSMETTFSRLENPDGYQADFRRAMVDLDAYFALPRPVKRWPPAALPPKKPASEMKVMAFCASPRKNGNTEIMIDEALRGVADAGASFEKIRLQSLKFRFCTACRRCKEPDFQDYCPIKDAMTDIYPKIAAADAVIIGFPVYTETHCGQLAAFLDRWDPFLWKKFKPKRGMVIGGWGGPDVDTYDHIIEHLMFILKIHRIETVEAISAGRLIGKFQGLDSDRRAILRRYPEELKKVYDAGRALVEGTNAHAPRQES